MDGERGKSSQPQSEERFPRFLSGYADLEELEALGELVEIPKGVVIAKADEVPRYCYIVKTGRIISYEYTAAGDERIHHVNEPGSIVLDANVLLQRRLPISFMTLQATKAVRIEQKALVNGIMADPQVALALLHSISYKFLSAMDQVNELCCHNSAWKVCNLLLSLAEQFGVPYDGKILIREHFSQRMIASLLGVNRATVLRTMKDLKDLNLIEIINGLYCVRSIESLKRHAKILDSQ